MQRQENTHLFGLLVKVYNRAVTDFFYFPDIVYVGNQKIERTDFEFLLAEELVSLTKFDSFGRYYVLSKKGDHLLQQLFARRQKKKTTPIPLTQG